MSARICSVDGCEAPHKARGFCMHHYQEQWRAGNWQVAACSIGNCERPVRTKGLCELHYTRLRRDVRKEKRTATQSLQRLADGIRVQGEHWIWTGAVYIGQPRWGGHSVRRTLYECAFGPVVKRCSITVECDEPLCVAPAHMLEIAGISSWLSREDATTTVAGCSVEGCYDEHVARGLCRRHYGEWYSRHSPEPKAELPPDVLSEIGSPPLRRGPLPKTRHTSVPG